MNILDEKTCRAALAHPAINHSQMARWFYENAPKVPTAPDSAFRRVLSVQPMTDRTRMRISLAVLNHFGGIAAAWQQVNSDVEIEGAVFL